MKLKLEPENKIRRGSLEELNDMYVLGVQRKGFSLLISQKSKNTFYFRQYIQHIYNIYNEYKITKVPYWKDNIYSCTGTYRFRTGQLLY